MKKWMLSLAIISLLALAACGESKSDEKTSSTQQKDVEITLPAEFFEGESEETIKASAKDQGIKDVTIEEDGSVTYTMAKEDHEVMLEQLTKDMATSIEEIAVSEEYPSIQDITYNKDFTEYNLTVDREAYENGFDSMVLFGLILSTTSYKLFEGEQEENVKVKFNYIDAATNQVYDSSIYPDDMEDSLDD